MGRGGIFMTMIIGVAVKPKGSRKPFFLMGSESRKIDVVDIVDGKYILDINDDFKKIYDVGDKLIGFAGRVPSEIFDDLTNFLNENLCNMEKTCEIASDFVKQYLSKTEMPEGVDYWRIRAIIGSMEKGFAQIAILTFDTRDLLNSGYVLKNQENYGFAVEFIGDTRKTEDLQTKFKNNNLVKNKNLTMLEVQKYADEYLKILLKDMQINVIRTQNSGN